MTGKNQTSESRSGGLPSGIPSASSASVPTNQAGYAAIQSAIINGAADGAARNPVTGAVSGGDLLRVLAADFRQQRTMLLDAWYQRLGDASPLGHRSGERDGTRSTVDAGSLFDSYISVLETGSVKALDAYAQLLAANNNPQQLKAADLLMALLLLRDVLTRSLAVRFHQAPSQLVTVLDTFEPAANRISKALAFSVVEEHERVIHQQQVAIKQLSTPVLQVRNRLLIHPIIGIVDADRARDLTEQLLTSIRTTRAKVVVVDITGVPSVDATVAVHLVQSVEAARLLGATVIISGISPDIARTLVTIGTDLTAIHAVGDLQAGIEEAEARLGLSVVSAGHTSEGSYAD